MRYSVFIVVIVLCGGVAASCRAAAAAPTPPRVTHDRVSGALAFYSAEPGTEPVVRVQLPPAGEGKLAAAAPTGAFSLRAAGRTWIADTPEAPVPPDTPAATVAVLDAPVTAERAAKPQGGGRIERLCVNRGGEGSVGLSLGGYVEIDDAAERPESFGEGTRVLAVDPSGRAGGPVMVAVWDHIIGVGPRPQVWEAALPGLTAEQVMIERDRVVVTPADSGHAMTVYVAHPAEPYAELVTAAETGAPPVLRIWHAPPGDRPADLLNHSIDAGGGLVDAEDPFAELGGLDGPDAAATRAKTRADRQADAERIREKLRRHIPSTKQGAGDRTPKARNSFFIVIVVHPRDDAPSVEVLPASHPALLRVGRQIIGVETDQIVFNGTRP